MTEEKKERYKVIIAQKVVFFDEVGQKFLLLKIKDEKGYFAEKYGVWDLIGGKYEGLDKNLDDAIKREIKEETGDIQYSVPYLLMTTEIFNRDGEEVIFLNYLARYQGGEIKVSSEHSEYRWESAENIEMDKNCGDWIKKIIKSAKAYIEKENALNNWKRCQADFENYKKLQAAHQEEFRAYAKMDVIEQILPVLDNFEASLAHVPEAEAGNKWVEGIVYIKKQLEDVLKSNDVEEIEVKPGDKFDPALHEAVAGKGEKISKVLQKGYRLNGRIVRAARVEVG